MHSQHMTNTERLHAVLAVHTACAIVERLCRESAVTDHRVTSTLRIAVAYQLGQVCSSELLAARAVCERLAREATAAQRHAITCAAMCCEPDAGWALTLVETAA